MGTVCAFQRSTKNTTKVSAVTASDRENELTAIIAAAELAFDQVYCGREAMASAA